MRNPISVLKNLEEKATQKGYVFERLYRNLYNPEFYLLAYQNIAKSQGSMTAGTDGMTLDDMTVLSNLSLSLRAALALFCLMILLIVLPWLRSRA